MSISRRIVLHFPARLVEQPIVYRLVKDYDLSFNILKASIAPDDEGLLVLEVSGERSNYEKGIKYLTQRGVRVEPLSQNVVRDEDRCTDCGACVALCPTHAFVVDPQSREVSFLGERCIVCGLCIKACPPRAMELRF